MAWLGRKKLAFVPLSRTNIEPPDVIPPDWSDQIMQRLFYDPPTNSTTGAPIAGVDRSVRAYFHSVSSGLASGNNRIYAVNQSGELLSYGDAGSPGNVSDPMIVGFGGWQAFQFLFAGANLSGGNRIYAVVS